MLSTAIPVLPGHCGCSHGHDRAGEEEQYRDPVQPDPLPTDTSDLPSKSEAIDAVDISRPLFFSSPLLPSVVRVPHLPTTLLSLAPTAPLAALVAQFKAVQSTRTAVTRHVLDPAFTASLTRSAAGPDHAAYAANEYARVAGRGMAVLGQAHAAMRKSGLLPPAEVMGDGKRSELAQWVRQVQALEKRRIEVTAEYQATAGETVYGERDLSEEVEVKAAMRDRLVVEINEALEEFQAWYAEVADDEDDE
ncbi:hypothetical protein H9P43_009720 [Blastocladiella emersonii ATCC 22665]|nr:hypothetical protein H9P43_009720 [Blastocladiella emersonii ATCC 22665]